MTTMRLLGFVLIWWFLSCVTSASYIEISRHLAKSRELVQMHTNSHTSSIVWSRSTWENLKISLGQYLACLHVPAWRWFQRFRWKKWTKSSLAIHNRNVARHTDLVKIQHVISLYAQQTSWRTRVHIDWRRTFSLIGMHPTTFNKKTSFPSQSRIESLCRICT